MEVLVVEDHPSIRTLLEEILLEDGFTVRTAENGAQALTIIEQQAPALVILDLQMPLMDGRVFYRALRALPSEVPVLILSAHGARAAKHELGANDAMDKPFDPDVLIERVRRLTGSG